MPDTIKRTTGTKVAFGDVVQLSKERSKDPEADGFERYIGLEHLEPSDLKVRSWGDLADGVTFTNIFRPGQVLFGKRRAYQRKVAVADFSGVCSGDIYVLEPKGDQLLPELLPFICQSEPFYDYVISMSQGGLSPRVNWKALAKYEFALPPLEEQRRIAKVLQAACDAHQQLTTLEGRLRTVKDALASNVFRDRHTRNVVALGDLVTVKGGKRLPAEAALSTERTSHPYIRVVDMEGGGIVSENLKFVPDSVFPSISRYIVSENDVLISIAGTIGRLALVPPELHNASLTENIAKLTNLNEKLTPEFLHFYLESQLGQRQIEAFTATSTQPKLALFRIKKIKIPLPPVDQQRKVCKQISYLNTLITWARDRREKSNHVQKTFLSSITNVDFPI